MRRFILAFTILSILGMAQNVVAGIPVPSGVASDGTADEMATMAVMEAASVAAAPVGGKRPEPRSLLLLIAGLSGLAAAGHRHEPARRSRESDPIPDPATVS
jgi:hypothetical protein